MIGFTPTAKTLYRQKIWFRDEPAERTSIFPLFDQNSQVKQIMVILSGVDDIFLIPWSPELIKLGFFGTKRLQLNLEELRSYSQFSFASFSGLYHFDPSWVLDKRRFWRYRELEQLRQTNCANRFKQRVTTVSFKHDLSELSKLFIESGSSNFSYQSVKLQEMTWREDHYGPKPVHSKQKVDNHLTSRWHLEPIWNEWGKIG